MQVTDGIGIFIVATPCVVSVNNLLKGLGSAKSEKPLSGIYTAHHKFTGFQPVL